MSAPHFYNLIGLALFLLGFHAFFTRRRLLKKILSLNVAFSGIFLLMISTAYAPAAGGRPDPVLQALVLTGIVIAVSTTAFALALAGRLGPPPGPGDGCDPPEGGR